MFKNLFGFRDSLVIESTNGIVCIGYNGKPVTYSTNFLFFLINIYVLELEI